MNLKQCKQAIKEKGLDPIRGKIYNIYECGCILRSNDEKQYRVSVGEKTIKACPEHKKDGKIVTRFKICTCGEFYLSTRMRGGKSCKVCYKPSDSNDLRLSKFNNRHLNDPSRYACVLRTGCLTKYLKFRCIPCKGCKDYQLAAGFRDPVKKCTYATI